MLFCARRACIFNDLRCNSPTKSRERTRLLMSCPAKYPIAGFGPVSLPVHVRWRPGPLCVRVCIACRSSASRRVIHPALTEPYNHVLTPWSSSSSTGRRSVEEDLQNARDFDSTMFPTFQFPKHKNRGDYVSFGGVARVRDLDDRLCS